MKRQRVYIDPNHADILSVIKTDKGMGNMGEVVEFILNYYLENNKYELTELLDARRREKE